jgi:hypothetical protein
MRKQSYDIDEMHLITHAAMTPVLLSLLAILIGLIVLCIMDAIDYDDFGIILASALLAGGALSFIVYGLNYLRVSAWVNATRKRHLAEWNRRACGGEPLAVAKINKWEHRK